MGAYLSVANREKESSDGENGALKYGVSAMQGWRSSMEDAHATLLDFDGSTSFFAVYDGHGGKAVARYCARHLHEILLTSEAYKKGNLDQALKDTFLRTDEVMLLEENREELRALASGLEYTPKVAPVTEKNENPPAPAAQVKDGEVQSSIKVEVRESTELIVKKENGAAEDEEEEEDVFLEAVEEHEEYWSSEEQNQENGSMNEATTAGCTAVVAVIRGGEVIVANAGDSRCVLSCKGVAVDMSKDHKPDLEEERSRIETADGFVEFGRVNGSLALSRAIGDFEYKRNPTMGPAGQMVTALPEIRSKKLDSGDEFLIIACDGIWDVMSSQEAVDFVRERLLKHPQRRLSATVEEMFDHCIAPNSDGNGLGMDNMSAVIVLINPVAN